MNRSILILLIAATTAFGAGCGKKKGSSAAPPPPEATFPAAPTDLPVAATLAEDEVELVVDGGSDSAKRNRLGDMFFTEPVNSPSNVRFGMTVQNNGKGYGGDVWIRFEDNGRTREAVLRTTHPLMGGVEDTSKNIWFDFAGKTVWHGFFQDLYGAVVVVIDSTIDLGDGQPSELLSGSVWYQNFSYAVPPQGPNANCWNISLGPYDCRTFIVGKNVVTTSAIYPNNFGNDSIPPRTAYKRLGTFAGLKRSKTMTD